MLEVLGAGFEVASGYIFFPFLLMFIFVSTVSYFLTALSPSSSLAILTTPYGS